MHERYLYPAVALLPLAITTNKKIPMLYLILSLVLLINCFVVLQSAFPQFNYSFLSSINLTGNWTRIIGLVSVLSSVYLALCLATGSLCGKK